MNFMFTNKRILVLAPHTDDGELGCGATIARAVRENAQVWYVAFSKCEESLPEGWPKDTLVREVKAATAELGILQEHVMVRDYKVRHFSESRQQILDDMILLSKEIEPDIIFIPSQHDIHQDHATIAAEGVRAFKKKNIFAYELPWNNLTFNNQAFIKVTKADAEKKVAALQKYESQRNRQYTSEESIFALLRTHGMQIGEEFSEVFEMPRIIF